MKKKVFDDLCAIYIDRSGIYIYRDGKRGIREWRYKSFEKLAKKWRLPEEEE